MSRPEPVLPGAGQESVWDYPRPPALVQRHEQVRVELGGRVIAETTGSWCVLETSHPPTYYLPLDAFAPDVLRPAAGSSFCEWKGTAAYLDLVVGDRTAAGAAWYYPSPSAAFAVLRDHVSLYPAATDGCFVDDERVQPQPGGFYGGWITSRVVGPFKGAPGTLDW